tara:strand:+ start:490 stop:612 length:123 start_codon:yes stop_codon:yes gene_type:complete
MVSVCAAECGTGNSAVARVWAMKRGGELDIVSVADDRAIR